MLGMGMGEMALIMVVALLVVPPEQLPKAMRQMGRWYGQVRRAADDLRRAFTLEADRQDASERYKELQERRRKAQELRKKVVEGESSAGPVAQPEAVSAPNPTPEPLMTGPDGHPTPNGPAPNDIPPDSPAHARPAAVAADEESR